MNNRIVYTPGEECGKKGLSRKGLFIAGVLALAVILPAGGIYALRQPYWQLKNIKISGLEVLEEDEIKAKINNMLSGEYVPFIPGSSFLLADTKAVAAELKKEFPKIKDAAVTKHFPDTLKISITERGLFGIFCGEANCAYVDKTGFAYESSPSSSGSLIVKIKSDLSEVKIGSQALDPLLMERIIFLEQGTERVIGSRVLRYELSSKLPREIRVLTSEGFKIYFNRDDDFENVFRVLKTVLEEEIKEKQAQLEYIDLRLGNKVFYKYK